MYMCQFPNCDYKTKYKSQVCFHHIIPQENEDTCDNLYNIICLCPNHHTKIYIPNASSGIHTINGDDSIILIGWLKSTGGKILEYINSNGETCYYKIGMGNHEY